MIFLCLRLISPQASAVHAFTCGLVAHEAALASFGDAAVFLDLEALAAYQRAKACLLLLDRIERPERGNLDLKICFRAVVELRHCVRRLVGPFAVNGARVASGTVACFLGGLAPGFFLGDLSAIEFAFDDIESGLLGELNKKLEPINVRLAIDNFGRTYSTFAEMPFEELKLDKSFVADCGTD